MEGWIMGDIRTSQFGGIPFGNNAARPANPTLGQPYFNGQEQRLELYAATGWQNIVSETPGVVSVSATRGAVGEAVLNITGTNFTTGAIASVIGTNGVEIQASSTTVNSIVSVTASFTGLSYLNDPYDVKLTNTSNLFGLLPDAFSVNQNPIWVTTAGSLGTFFEQSSVTLSALSATDPETQISYTLASGSSLPSGLSLNSSTGVISGTLPNITTNTTYTFTVNASDGVNTVARAFSLTSTAYSSSTQVEYLVVAGGGGGGNQDLQAGGGGAGGYRSSVTGETSGGGASVESKITFNSGDTTTITVGNGGSVSNNGSNSIFATVTSIGGGKGGDEGTTSTSGASGGGGSWGGGGTNNPGGAGTSGQGYSGGSMTGGNFEPASPYSCGGGGGAGGVGGSANKNAATPGSGGIGVQSSITGTATYYAGGGGGGSRGGGNGAGGTGGGGTGRVSAGSSNTGGGGGAGYAGGSGVVIIAYPETFSPISSIPGTLTYTQPSRAGYRVYRFTSGTGTITF
jgi:hypothetical protein